MLPCSQAEPHPDAAEGAAVAGAAHVERHIHPYPGIQLIGDELLDDSKQADLTVQRHACRSLAHSALQLQAQLYSRLLIANAVFSVCGPAARSHRFSVEQVRPAQAASTAPCSRERHCHSAPAEGGMGIHVLPHGGQAAHGAAVQLSHHGVGASMSSVAWSASK